MRSRVSVRDMVSGDLASYTLCYPVEADFDAGRLSVLAPIGAALLGYREGDVVERPVPGGVRVLKIEKLLHQPEAAKRPRRVVES
jgi:regulator of nucleoside diphosphate kinase